MDFLRRRLSDGNFLAGGGWGDGGDGRGPPPSWGGAGRPPRTPPPTAPLLLVIAPPGTDWVKPFKGKSVHGDVELRVEQLWGGTEGSQEVLGGPRRFLGCPPLDFGVPQAQFSELSLAASTHGALSVTIDPPRGGSRRVRPDFVLVREEPEGGAGGAPRRLLVGLHLGGVPGSDPLPTVYGFSHAPCLVPGTGP
ncbi:synapsin-1-like [Vidua macroura]|uniref:synapsin-1-like n=1 Tax=Vidua macroura TaxID=187451 RepID=UPI0023A874AD|nr:synapsin-1-like [Vidua macroura]